MVHSSGVHRKPDFGGRRPQNTEEAQSSLNEAQLAASLNPDRRLCAPRN